MIDKDILLVSVVIIFILLMVYLYAVNSKRIVKHQSQEKLKRMEEAITVENMPEEEDEIVHVTEAKYTRNYLHDLFNPRPASESEPVVTAISKDVELEEATEEDITKTVKAIGIKKKVSNVITDHEQEFNDVGNIVYDMDNSVDEFEDYEQDYKIADEDDDIEFENNLSEEFNNLSPAMKSFIINNLFKNKTNNDFIDEDIH